MQVNTILITGATGFVGRALSARMIEGSWQLRGAVRNPEQANQLPSGMESTVIGSIGPDTDWTAALEGVDMVIHLAGAVAKGGVGSSQEDIFHRVNVLGSRHLAEAAAESGVRRLVYLSSIEVNGTASYGKPFTEDDEPNPQTNYGSSKLETERELQELSRSTGIEVVIIRPPLIYGPGHMGNLMSLIKSLLNRGLPLPLASVANKRSFIYVENLLDAIISCCDSPDAAGNIFLVSDGAYFSTPDLVRLIASELKKKPKLFPLPYTWLKLAGKCMGKSSTIKLLTDSYHLDDSKIQQVVGWNSPFSMEEGIRQTLKASIQNNKK